MCIRDRFSYPLAAGETFTVPEVIMSYSADGFSQLSHQYHTDVYKRQPLIPHAVNSLDVGCAAVRFNLAANSADGGCQGVFCLLYTSKPAPAERRKAGGVYQLIGARS